MMGSSTTSGSSAISPPVTQQRSNLSDEFLMHVYKVEMCKNTTRHSWKSCPFAHAEEHARRRPLAEAWYSSELCPRIRRGIPCPDGDACRYAHHVFESHLHPDRYKTSLCSEGPRCARPLCFFAHDASELRCVAPMGAVKSSSPVVGTAPPVPAAAPSSVLAGGSLAAPLPQQTYLSAPQLPMAMQPTRAGSAPKLALLAPAGAPASGALPLPRSESGASQLTHGSPSLVRAVSGTAGGSGSATGIGPEVTQQLLQLLWLQERQQVAIADTLSLLVAQQNLLAPVGGGTTAPPDWLVATDFEPNPLLPAGSAWPAAPLEGGEPAPLMHDLLFGSSL